MKINPRIFWTNVRNLREDRGWTQGDIAEKLGVNVRNYNNKERVFSTTLTADFAQKVAEVLGTTVETLASGVEPEPIVDPSIITFWNNVKARREGLGLSQKAIAEKLGMSHQNYQTKETGKAPKLPKELAAQIANILGCTIDELWGVTIESNKVQVNPVINTPEKHTAIVTQGREVNDISHLPPFVQRFLSKKENADFIINAVGEYLSKL